MIKAKTIKCKLPDVATYERSKKGKVYPKGCTLLQVSATKGQLIYLYKDQTVESKYCVINPDRNIVDPFFFYSILQKGMPEFLSKEQTGLNIKPQILDRYPVQYFADMSIQKYIAAEQYLYEMEMRFEQEQIDMMMQFKKYLLQKMFC